MNGSEFFASCRDVWRPRRNALTLLLWSYAKIQHMYAVFFSVLDYYYHATTFTTTAATTPHPHPIPPGLHLHPSPKLPFSVSVYIH